MGEKTSKKKAVGAKATSKKTATPKATPKKAARKPSPARTRLYKLQVDKRQVDIPVKEALFVRVEEQFLKKKGDQAKDRRTTLNNLLRAAYKKGVADGKGK